MQSPNDVSSPFVPSFPPLAAFAGSPIYFTGEDALRLSVQDSAAGVTVTLTGRMLPFGSTRPVPFKHTLTPATDRTVSTAIIGIGDGWLLNAQIVVSSGAPLTGQCFARLSVQKGLTASGDDLFTLCAGYPTAKQPVSYPGSPILNSTDGAGALRSISGTSPAAGAQILETVPTGARWELLSFVATLTTSATVATRLVTLLLSDGSFILQGVPQPQGTVASGATRYTFAAGIGAYAAGINGTATQGLAAPTVLGGGHTIATFTAAMQAADQWSLVQYLVRERIEGA